MYDTINVLEKYYSMTTTGNWILPSHITAGKFHIVRKSTKRAYRIWNDTPAGRGNRDLRVYVTGIAGYAYVLRGTSCDVTGTEIMIRKQDTAAGRTLKGRYEELS